MGQGGRRAIAVLVGIAGLCGGAYVFFLVFFIGQGFFGQGLSLPLGLVCGSVLPIAAASLAGPRSDRGKIAMAFGLIAIAFSIVALGELQERLWPAVVAGAGTAAAALWFSAAQRRYCYTASALSLALLAASFFGWPAWRESPPTDWKDTADGSWRFYRYRLSAFIDSEDLWRIDGAPEAIEAAAGKMGMSRVNQAPGQFWWMPPYYWPRGAREGGLLFSTPNFPAGTRGPDGQHYFMLLDPVTRRAFVWAKNNF